jgi:hypothetical protein
MSFVLYPGSGFDFKIVNTLFQMNHFVFIDRNPMDSLGYPGEKPDTTIKLLEMAGMLEGFHIVEKKGKMLTFSDYNERFIYYFINTIIPLRKPTAILKDLLKKCDTIIMKGFIPHRSILKYIQTPVHLLKHSNTCYYIDKEEPADMFGAYKHLLDNSEMIKTCHIIDEEPRIINCI